jgi:hypothetical protein
MKKLIILLPIILTASCSTPQKTQCDTENNYIISNPELMEKYKEEFKNGEIKSLYYDKTSIGYESTSVCNSSFCVYYDNKKFDYIEKKINDPLRKGVYTIYNHPKNDKRCNFSNRSWDKVCYESIKNENNEIKSKYGLTMYNDKNATVAEFKNNQTNELLYKYSKTIYTTGAIGGAGFGVCSPVKINNNYKFNAGSFPTNPFDEPYKF